jgi:hypothetical protein
MRQYTHVTFVDRRLCRHVLLESSVCKINLSIDWLSEHAAPLQKEGQDSFGSYLSLVWSTEISQFSP